MIMSRTDYLLRGTKSNRWHQKLGGDYFTSFRRVPATFEAPEPVRSLDPKERVCQL